MPRASNDHCDHWFVLSLSWQCGTWKTTTAQGGGFEIWGSATDDVWMVGGNIQHLE